MKGIVLQKERVDQDSLTLKSKALPTHPPWRQIKYIQAEISTIGKAKSRTGLDT